MSSCAGVLIHVEQKTLKSAVRSARDLMVSSKEAVTLDEQVKLANNSKNNAVLGYASMRVSALTQMLQVAGTNRRKLDPAHVRQLVKDLEREGLQPFEETNVIRVGIKKEWINVESLGKKASTSLPHLEWIVELMIAKPVLFDGKHCIAALLERVKPMIEERKALAITIAARGDGPEKEEAKKTLAELDRKIEECSSWAVILYDLGKHCE